MLVCESEININTDWPQRPIILVNLLAGAGDRHRPTCASDSPALFIVTVLVYSLVSILMPWCIVFCYYFQWQYLLQWSVNFRWVLVFHLSVQFSHVWVGLTLMGKFFVPISGPTSAKSLKCNWKLLLIFYFDAFKICSMSFLHRSWLVVIAESLHVMEVH